MHSTLTCEIVDGQTVAQIKGDMEIEIMIERLIPSAKAYPMLHFAVNPDNTKLLRMVMREFPLEIKTPELWQKCLDEVKQMDDLEKTLSNLKPVEPTKQHFIGKLLPFQKLGLDFILKSGGKTLLADEMGLGKTIQSLAFIAQKPDAVPVVVVAPLVTLQNWKREIEKFLRLPVDSMLVDGISTPRIQIIRSGKQQITQAEFYLINYELLYKQGKNLIQAKPSMIIFDEVQSLRNPTTSKYMACSALAKCASVKYRLGLSGTPIYNRGVEMYGIADTIRPGVLGDKEEFIRRYCMNWNSGETEKDKRSMLADRLQKSIMIRRKKIDVLPDLPGKNRLQQDIEIDVELYEKRLQELYTEIESVRSNVRGLDDKAGLFELNKEIREMRVKERQIAGLSKVPYVARYIMGLLEDYSEEKFVIFCHHRSVHSALYETLYKYQPLQIIGGQTDKIRQHAIDEFQNNSSRRVVICGLRAGNVGINLTSSSYVIFAELDWSPAIHRQAEDRLHRIGQNNPVFAHYLIGIGTFDEMLTDVLVSKSVEINSALGDKMEALNNKKAMEILTKRFGGSQLEVLQ